ncbi:hypothetical protein ACNNLS_07245 [Aerococcus viridans]
MTTTDNQSYVINDQAKVIAKVIYYGGWYAERVYPYEDIEGQFVNASGQYTINELENKDITFY